MALYTPSEPAGNVTDGFVSSWAPSATICVFAKRLVLFAARSSAARCISSSAVLRLLLFATACAIASRASIQGHSIPALVSVQHGECSLTWQERHCAQWSAVSF